MEDDKMKKINLVKIALIMLAFTFFGFKYAVAENLNEENIRENIVKNVGYPDFAKEKSLQGLVRVIFGFDEKGNMIIYSARSEYSELADYVKETISKIQMTEKNIDIEKLYNIDILFKLL
jgi:hypothetical protein